MIHQILDSYNYDIILKRNLLVAPTCLRAYLRKGLQPGRVRIFAEQKAERKKSAATWRRTFL